MDLCWQSNVSLICCLDRSLFFFQGASVLISWLRSPSVVILEPPKIKSVIVSIVSSSVCHEMMGLDAMILVFECWVLSQLFSYNFHHHLCVDISPPYKIKSKVFSLTLRLCPSFSRPTILVLFFVVFLEIHMFQPPWTLDDLWAVFYHVCTFPHDFHPTWTHYSMVVKEPRLESGCQPPRCVTFLSLSFPII